MDLQTHISEQINRYEEHLIRFDNFKLGLEKIHTDFLEANFAVRTPDHHKVTPSKLNQIIQEHKNDLIWIDTEKSKLQKKLSRTKQIQENVKESQN